MFKKAMLKKAMLFLSFLVVLVLAQTAMTPRVGASGAPATPASLTIYLEYCHGLNTAEWSAVSGATYYELYGSSSPSFPSQWLVTSTTGTFDAFSVSGTTYLRVRACNASGCSGYRVGNQPAKYFSGCF